MNGGGAWATGGGFWITSFGGGAWSIDGGTWEINGGAAWAIGGGFWITSFGGGDICTAFKTTQAVILKFNIVINLKKMIKYLTPLAE